MKTQSDSGPHRALHLRPPRPKVVAEIPIRKKNLRSQKESRTYGALQLETIGIKKSVIARPSKRRSQQTLAGIKAVLNKMMVILSLIANDNVF